MHVTGTTSEGGDPDNQVSDVMSCITVDSISQISIVINLELHLVGVYVGEAFTIFA